MKTMRIFVVALLAMVVSTLVVDQAGAQPAVSNGSSDPSTPPPPPAIFILRQPTVVESLAGVAEAGNVDAMNLLGVLYTTGTQVPRDTSMALYWFQKAIDGGSADAMDNLATMYLFGIGLSRDPANALRWYERSAVRGNVHGIYSAAVMVERGLGTARNPQLARAMYRRAAEFGFTPAMLRVSDDYAHGTGTKRDLVEAYAWLQVALQSGLPDELQIAALASMEDLEGRLGTQRRDEARERAARVTALLKTRALPAERRAPTARPLASL